MIVSLNCAPGQIFKILAPYAMLAICFALLNTRLRLPPFSLFLVALTITDGAHASVHRDTAHELIRSLAVMTMTFFLNVTDTGTSQCFSAARCATQRIVGSWLEIGQTISFFCISSMLLVLRGFPG